MKPTPYAKPCTRCGAQADQQFCEMDDCPYHYPALDPMDGHPVPLAPMLRYALLALIFVTVAYFLVRP